MNEHSRFTGIYSEKDKHLTVLKCNSIFLEYAGVKTRDEIIGHTDEDFPWASYAHLYRKHEFDALAGKSYSTLIPFKDYKGNDLLFLHTKIKKQSSNNQENRIICRALEIVSPPLMDLCQTLKEQMADKIFTLGKPHAFKLSNRQKEILFYLARGKKPKAIAQFLNLSVRTVEHYIELIKEKTGCHFQSELIDLCYQYNLHNELPLTQSVEHLRKFIKS